MTVRTRIEPAPSGSIHVGNARTALFSWAYARHHAGKFVLRIADTDAKRVNEDNYHAVLEDFRWLGLDWDEGPEVGGPAGPYRQSERFDIYREYADKLLDGGFAYRCYLTDEEIDAERKSADSGKRPPSFRSTEADEKRFADEGRPFTVRVIVPSERTITFHDEVLGDISTDMGRTPDFVIMRSDGTPTYMLAVTVDDALMEITHIIRGNDLMASTPRQLLIREALGFKEPPVFAHLPMIVTEDGKPLSKRWGDVSVRSYRENGFLADAVVNYLALLGWSLDERTNIFSRDELVSNFSLERVGKSPAAFDVDKLEWVNGHYIRTSAPEDLIDAMAEVCVEHGIPDANTPDGKRILSEIAPHLIERMKRLTETPPMVKFLFEEVAPDEKAAATLEGQGDYLAAVAESLQGIEPWTAAAIEAALRSLAEAKELKPKKAFQPIRAAVTGTLVSPPLFESLEILGKERTLERLRRAA